jgi:hypothetical protein
VLQLSASGFNLQKVTAEIPHLLPCAPESTHIGGGFKGRMTPGTVGVVSDFGGVGRIIPALGDLDG